jgi:hypothetical protein
MAEEDEPYSATAVPLILTGRPSLVQNPGNKDQPLVLVPGVNAITHARTNLILHPAALLVLKSFCRRTEQRHPEIFPSTIRSPGDRPPPEWLRRAFDSGGNGQAQGGGGGDP